VRVVVDAMGGDHHPEAPVQGAMEALAALPDADALRVIAAAAVRAPAAGADPLVAAVMLALAAQQRRAEAFDAWLREGQRKIALLAPTLADLEHLERAARARGLPTVWVEDAGYTEVPAGTRTCLGIGPAPSAELDAVTGSLDLF
jgi:PTH2 family peptidyl-tRNA hydrolase